jgi:hypothetical protein
MKRQAGYARPKPLPPMEINPPVTSHGLTGQDCLALADYAEVQLLLSDRPDKQRRLAELAHHKRILHLRFDKTCDHRHCGGKTHAVDKYRW